jgi:hypothetical protein
MQGSGSAGFDELDDAQDRFDRRRLLTLSRDDASSRSDAKAAPERQSNITRGSEKTVEAHVRVAHRHIGLEALSMLRRDGVVGELLNQNHAATRTHASMHRPQHGRKRSCLQELSETEVARHGVIDRKRMFDLERRAEECASPADSHAGCFGGREVHVAARSIDSCHTRALPSQSESKRTASSANIEHVVALAHAEPRRDRIPVVLVANRNERGVPPCQCM